jgi:hypothetical protein
MCCNPFSNWGVWTDAPNIKVLNHSDEATFLFTGEPNDFVLPETPSSSAAGWGAKAAKVPAWYPYGCETNPLVSSVELPEGLGKWAVDLRTIGQKDLTDNGDGTHSYIYGNWGAICTSRAIYEDGQQTLVTYAISPEIGEDGNPVKVAFAYSAKIKDHAQIDIGGQTVTKFDAQWRTSVVDYSDLSLISNLDYYWAFGYDGMPGPGSGSGNKVEGFFPYDGTLYYPVQCIAYGKRFYSRTSFMPDPARRAGDTYYWTVARLDYSDMSVLHNFGAVPKYGNNGAFGDYLLMQPSVRAFLLSEPPEPLAGSFSDPESRLPDEPWWTAVNADRNKLVTGRWLSTTLRSFDDDTPTSDAFTGFADGTMTEAEVANVIVDAADPPDEYPDEAWENIQVWCYQHINGIDTGIFTTDPDDEEPIQTLTSDFGIDGMSPTLDIDHGLKGGLHWESIGDHGDDWAPDTDGYFNDAPDYVNHDTTKVSLRANCTPAFVGEVSAELRGIQWAESATQLLFDFRLDNSTYGLDGRPTNFPATDPDGNHDELQLWIDGVMVWSTDNGDEPADYPTFLDFWGSAARHGSPVAIDMTPGEHRIRFTLKRVTDNNKLHAWIDNIQLKVMVGDDPTGVKRWFFFSDPARPSLQKVWRAGNWKWPRRYSEDETPTDLTSRASTIPEFITYDWRNERLYLGCPHYTLKVRMDAGHEGEVDGDYYGGGIIEWTASPAIPPPEGYNDGDCNWVSTIGSNAFDTVADPPYGKFQIRVAEKFVQITGANASWRDASGCPLPLHLFPKNEKFVRRLNVHQLWSERAHAWTLSHDGRTRVPHVELLMKPYWDQPAFPVPPPYEPNLDPDTGDPLGGPWPEWMEYDSEDLPPYPSLDAIYARWRDPRKAPITTREVGTHMEDGSFKPQWADLNKIIPRTYSASSCMTPQFSWIHNPNPDPTDPGEDGFPDPPWPSAQYRIMPTYMNPIPMSQVYQLLNITAFQCAQYDDDHIEIGWHYVLNSGFPTAVGSSGDLPEGFFPYDFDVVDDADMPCCLSELEQEDRTTS